jgi:GTPase
MPMPVVAIVGRPNVGKSSLLNALAGKRISIVQDMPGVTRDRISTPLRVAGKWVELVDTGGYGFEDSQGLTDHIKEQIEHAMVRADLVLFIVDAHTGLTEGDRIIAKLLRENEIDAVAVANKVDGKQYELIAAEFAELGLGTPHFVSATTTRGLDELRILISDKVDLSEAPEDLPDAQMLLAIVGKRNAGKSTFVNAVSTVFEDDPERVIVSEVPGTTRDSVDVRFEKDGKTLIVIDTAGVRKKRHMVADDIEFYSFHRAQRSVRRADVVVQMLDAMEPISEPDKKLAQYIIEQHKPVVIVLNKWDLLLEEARKQNPEASNNELNAKMLDKFREYVNVELRGLNHAPVTFITAKDLKKVQVVLDLAQKLFKQTTTRLTTSKLNDAVEKVMAERAPTGGVSRARPKVYYATQVDVSPPTIVLFVNKLSFFDSNYQRFMVNRFREYLPFENVPIKLFVRERERKDVSEFLDTHDKGGKGDEKKKRKPTGKPRRAVRDDEDPD